MFYVRICPKLMNRQCLKKALILANCIMHMILQLGPKYQSLVLQLEVGVIERIKNLRIKNTVFGIIIEL